MLFPRRFSKSSSHPSSFLVFRAWILSNNSRLNLTRQILFFSLSSPKGNEKRKLGFLVSSHLAFSSLLDIFLLIYDIVIKAIHYAPVCYKRIAKKRFEYALGNSSRLIVAFLLLFRCDDTS